MTRIRIFTALSLLFFLGCSDSGDSPTSPSGNTPNISVSDVSILENNNAVVTISLSNASDSSVSVDFATGNGTAVSGADYTSNSGTAVIAAGQTSTTVTVTIVDDSSIETQESFTLVLSNPVNGTISDGTATISIRDNDGVSFSADIRPIIQNNGCLGGGCHGSGSSSGGFSFGSAAYSNVRNASGDHGAIIIPQNSGSSNFYLKVTSTPPFGSRMPVGGALTTTDQNKIKDWIDQGAQDN